MIMLIAYGDRGNLFVLCCKKTASGTPIQRNTENLLVSCKILEELNAISTSIKAARFWASIPQLTRVTKWRANL